MKLLHVDVARPTYSGHGYLKGTLAAPQWELELVFDGELVEARRTDWAPGACIFLPLSNCNSLTPMNEPS